MRIRILHPKGWFESPGVLFAFLLYIMKLVSKNQGKKLHVEFKADSVVVRIK